MHKLTGTRSQAGPEPEALPPGRPRYPKGLAPEARRVFKRLSDLLVARRHLTEGDVELLRLYALLYVRHAKALAKIEEEGEICVYTRLDSNGQAHDQEKENLWLKVATNAEKNMVAILDRLGLTPHNRAKVKPTKKNDDTEPKNEFEQFMERKTALPAPLAQDEEDTGETDFEA